MPITDSKCSRMEIDATRAAHPGVLVRRNNTVQLRNARNIKTRQWHLDPASVLVTDPHYSLVPRNNNNGNLLHNLQLEVITLLFPLERNKTLSGARSVVKKKMM